MPSCETCKRTHNAPESVPYIVHESSMARMERHTKRLWIVLLVVVVMLFTSNIGWVIHESQFGAFHHEQGGEGINNVNFGEQGDYNCAEGEVQEEEEEIAGQS